METKETIRVSFRGAQTQRQQLLHLKPQVPPEVLQQSRLAKDKALLKAQLCMSVHRHSCQITDGRHKQTEAGKGMVRESGTWKQWGRGPWSDKILSLAGEEHEEPERLGVHSRAAEPQSPISLPVPMVDLSEQAAQVPAGL